MPVEVFLVHLLLVGALVLGRLLRLRRVVLLVGGGPLLAHQDLADVGRLVERLLVDGLHALHDGRQVHHLGVHLPPVEVDGAAAKVVAPAPLPLLLRLQLDLEALLDVGRPRLESLAQRRRGLRWQPHHELLLQLHRGRPDRARGALRVAAVRAVVPRHPFASHQVYTKEIVSLFPL